MTRLTVALDGLGGLAPGHVLVLHPRADLDLSEIPELQVVQPFRPDHDHFAAHGYEVAAAPSGDFATALVCCTRSKAETRGLIAQAAACAPLVLVDGQKADGIESHLRDVKKRTEIAFVASKAHGKIFAFRSGGFEDWAVSQDLVDGFATVPGVFSADGVDPASALLAQALPGKLPAKLADLGAGWGYLSHMALARDGVQQMHLIEADRRALDLAQNHNVQDPRAQFHWADATTHTLPEPMGGVIMNPPFHQSRAADPSIGRAFIAAAARLLAPNGKLWCVANRHLPYEAEALARFAQVGEIGGDRRFKIILAEKPRRERR